MWRLTRRRTAAKVTAEVTEKESPIFNKPLSHLSIEFVKECTTFFKTYAKHERGIFRISGDSIRVNELKQLTSGWCSKPSEVHEISSLFKAFFRELPEPLLTFELYDCWISAYAVGGEARYESLRKVLMLLPPINRVVLELLCDMLHFISQHSEVNLMNTQNLSIVFAPNILRPQVESPITIISDARYTYGVVAELIDNFEKYFRNTTPTPSQESPSTEVTSGATNTQTSEELTFGPQISDFVFKLRERYNRHRSSSSRHLNNLRMKRNLDESQFNAHLEEVSQLIQEAEVVAAQRSKNVSNRDESQTTSTDSGSESAQPEKTTETHVYVYPRRKGRGRRDPHHISITNDDIMQLHAEIYASEHIEQEEPEVEYTDVIPDDAWVALSPVPTKPRRNSTDVAEQLQDFIDALTMCSTNSEETVTKRDSLYFTDLPEGTLASDILALVLSDDNTLESTLTV